MLPLFWLVCCFCSVHWGSSSGDIKVRVSLSRIGLGLLGSLTVPWCFGSDYGVTGLIDIPTAYMSEDAVFSSSVATQNRTDSYSLTYQLAPWAETTFRYTKYKDYFNYDRNYEVKLRLLEETYYTPQVSLGMRDFIGTGLISTEYLVLSKTLGSLELTAGIGWGTLAGDGVIRNPLTTLSNQFENRTRDVGQGGEFEAGTLFSGKEIGVFGGAKFNLDSIPVSLLVEHNPDQYANQVSRGGPEPSSPISWGVQYKPFEGVELTVSRQHQDEWGARLKLSTDTSLLTPRKPEVAPQNQELPDGFDKTSWYDNLLFAMEESGLFLFEGALNAEGDTAFLLIGNQHYQLQADAINRATKLADLHLPPSVDTIMFTLREYGHEAVNVKVGRPSTLRERQAPPIDFYPELYRPEEIASPQHLTNFFTGKMAFDVTLANRLQLFDPDNPLRYQFALRVGAAMELPYGYSLKGSYGIDIDNNFDEIRRGASSVLPHVRTDVAKYLKQGDTGIESLFIDKRGNAADNIYYRLYGGLLEEMYSGLGWEMMMQPYKSRLAYGLSMNWVKKRDFDKSFDHRGYNTVTAFFSLYWATPFYNYDVAVHAGRYLAEDVGATFEIRRTFDNGWSVGVWSTFTDVSSEEFGEGSFDKGFFFRIPFDALSGRNTRAAYQTRIRPIQRDGGQRLEDYSGTLWFDLRASRFDALSGNRGRMRVR